MNKRKISALLFMAASAVSAIAQTLNDGLQALDFDRYEHARSIFTSLTQQEPANGVNYYYLGQAYFNLYKSDSAAWAYNKGISADPNNMMNYVGLGELALDAEKKAEAKVQFDKALSFSRAKDGKIRDINALRLVAASMVSTDTKMTDEAVGYIQQAYEMDKKNYEVLVTAGDVYLEKNEGGKAATMYENAIAVQKNNPKAYTKVSNIWLRVKNAEATKTELDRALAINPNYAPALKNLAEFYSQSKQYVKAKEAFLKYLQNSESSSANKARYARILFRNKEYAEALTVINDLQQTDKSDVYLYRLAGYSYYEVGNDTKDTSKFRPGVAALNYFISHIDSTKLLSNDYEYLGKLYSRIPEEDSLAIVYINKAIATDPNKIELYKEAGMIYNRVKKFDLAIVAFESYISKTSKVLPADYYLLGMASYFGKQFGKADSAFSKLIEVKPDYAEGYLWKGNANAFIDPDAKTTVAKESYEKFITLTEANPDKYKKNLITSYNYLGKYAIKKDDNATAKSYFNKILALDPDNKEVKEYMKQLK
jgi:tetratricopeptide (TPR) repeat protein